MCRSDSVGDGLVPARRWRPGDRPGWRPCGHRAARRSPDGPARASQTLGLGSLARRFVFLGSLLTVEWALDRRALQAGPRRRSRGLVRAALLLGPSGVRICPGPRRPSRDSPRSFEATPLRWGLLAAHLAVFALFLAVCSLVPPHGPRSALLVGTALRLGTSRPLPSLSSRSSPLEPSSCWRAAAGDAWIYASIGGARDRRPDPGSRRVLERGGIEPPRGPDVPVREGVPEPLRARRPGRYGHPVVGNVEVPGPNRRRVLRGRRAGPHARLQHGMALVLPQGEPLPAGAASRSRGARGDMGRQRRKDHGAAPHRSCGGGAVAKGGFHSQAGWILFNAHSPRLRRGSRAPRVVRPRPRGPLGRGRRPAEPHGGLPGPFSRDPGRVFRFQGCLCRFRNGSTPSGSRRPSPCSGSTARPTAVSIGGSGGRPWLPVGPCSPCGSSWTPWRAPGRHDSRGRRSRLCLPRRERPG